MYRSKKEIQFANALSEHFCNFDTNPKDIIGTPDVFFRKIDLAVFFNGCFWHSHHCHHRKLNEKWKLQLANIRTNDQLVLETLTQSGIAIVTIWECEWDHNEEAQIAKLYDYINLSENYGIKFLNKSVSSVSSIVA